MFLAILESNLGVEFHSTDLSLRQSAYRQTHRETLYFINIDSHVFPNNTTIPFYKQNQNYIYRRCSNKKYNSPLQNMTFYALEVNCITHFILQ